MDIVIICNQTNCSFNKKEIFVNYGEQDICTNRHPIFYETLHQRRCAVKSLKPKHITTHDLLEIDEAKAIQKKGDNSIPFGCLGCKQSGGDKDKDYCMNICPIKMENEPEKRGPSFEDGV